MTKTPGSSVHSEVSGEEQGWRTLGTVYGSLPRQGVILPLQGLLRLNLMGIYTIFVQNRGHNKKFCIKKKNKAMHLTQHCKSSVRQ